MSEQTKQGRLADLPLEERRRLDAERQRELEEGLSRAHVVRAHERDCYAAVQLDRVLRAAPALAAKLRGE